MPSFAGWVPLRWFAGPLDSPATPHETWLKPETLTLLKGTPINCLVVNWSAGRPEDSAQQQALRTLIERAKADKLAIVGRVTSTASGAKAAGLDAIIADAAKVDGDEGLPIIPTSVAGAVPKGTSLICATKALWPRIPGSWRTQEDRAERTEAGPTGAPWVDSNGWLAMTVAAKAPDTRLWLMPDLPKTVASLRAEQYELAVADAAAYGARWVLTFDPDFRARLGKRETEALESFKKISKAVEALRTVPAAQAKQQTKLLIASNFEGAADKLAGEMVNLVGRRHLQSQVARVDTLTSPAPDNITTLLLIVDRDPPSSLHKYIESFTSRGGLVIGPASLAHFAPREATGNFDQRFDLYTMGKGKLAIARQPWTDPYQLAVDTHLMMSRKQDLVRLWNAGSTNVRYTASKNSGYVQVLNYAARAAGHPMSLWVANPYRTARLRTLNGVDQTLEITSRNGGSEVSLPPFPVYATVEFQD